MFRIYKYLLRPTRRQETMLDFLLQQSRFVYNKALEQRIQAYQETGQTPHFASQWPYFRDLRHVNPDTLGKLNVSCLLATLRRLEWAYGAFFRRLKSGETPGFPKFKSERSFQSFEIRYGNGCKLRFSPQGRAHFYVQNVGEIRMCFHRNLPENSSIRRAIIKRKNDRWNVFLIVKMQMTDPQPKPIATLGIDVGLKSLLAFSNGTLIENPRWFQNKLSRLRLINCHVCRSHKGSHRRVKSSKRVARFYEKVANQRRDYLHKITRILVDNNKFIAIEDISMEFMIKNEYLALESRDASLATFRHFLEYKAIATGVKVVAVKPAYTSQRCSGCGELVEKDLDTRVHACPHCGLVLDRDVNAARNILQAALAQVNTQ